MSRERLEQEIAQAVDAMNHAAAKIGEQGTALADLKTQLDAAKAQLAEAQAAAASGGDITTALDTMASQLDGAQTALDAALAATGGAQEAVTSATDAAASVSVENTGGEQSPPADPGAPTG
jgi:chromosome segregation ATPase